MSKVTCLLQCPEAVDGTASESLPHFVDSGLDGIQRGVEDRISLRRKQLAIAIGRQGGAAFSVGHPEPVGTIFVVHGAGTLVGWPDFDVERFKTATRQGPPVARGRALLGSVSFMQKTPGCSHVSSREEVGKEVTSKTFQEVGIAKLSHILRFLGKFSLPKCRGVAGRVCADSIL